MSCVNLTRRFRCNSGSSCCYRAREHVDPTSSRKIRCGGDSHPEMPSSPGSVGLARAHPQTNTQVLEPSRQTRSCYGPPYPLGRWSSAFNVQVYVGALVLSIQRTSIRWGVDPQHSTYKYIVYWGVWGICTNNTSIIHTLVRRSESG